MTQSPLHERNGTYNPWPHRLAVLLVCATFPLIWVGGLVTTYDAGMAVPDWPNTYGYNLFLYPISTWLSGPWDLFIEHGHRLIASVVGLITIALVGVTWRMDRRRWVRAFVLGCLALVVAQGVLGGLRVLLDETVLARLHGCVGPVFFVAAVVAAAVTSQWWTDALRCTASPATTGFERLAWFTAGFAYLQLVLGAHLRHVSFDWPPTIFRGLVLAHLLVAAILTGHVVMLWLKAFGNPQLRTCRLIQRPLQGLVVLVGCQLVLGALTWRMKYGWPTWLPQPAAWRGLAVTAESMAQAVITTAHVAVGSLILVTGTLLAVRTHRLFGRTNETTMLAAAARRSLEVLV